MNKKFTTSQLVTLTIILENHRADLKNSIDELKAIDNEQALTLCNAYKSDIHECNDIIQIIENIAYTPNNVDQFFDMDVMSQLAGLTIKKDK